MKYYYADSQNKTAGPVSLEEMDRLIGSGHISADPMVVPEGASEWRPYSQLGGSPTESLAPAQSREPTQFASSAAASVHPTLRSAISHLRLPFRPTIIAELLFDKPFAWLGRVFTANTLIQGLAWCTSIGHLAVFAGLCIGLISGIVLAIRQNNLYLLLLALLLVLAAALGQYLADRMLAAAGAAIANTPHCISSDAVLVCMDIILKFAAVVLLLVGLVFWANESQDASWTVAFPEFALRWALPALACFAISTLARHAESVNVKIGEVAAGEDAVGLLGFLLKGSLKVVPIAFCVIACLGLFVSVYALFNSGPDSAPLFPGLAQIPFFDGLGALLGTISGLALTMLACLVPLYAYFWFLVMNLLLELMRSVLILPRTVAASKSKIFEGDAE